MLHLVGYYVYILVKTKVIRTWLTKFITFVYHPTQFCLCVLVIFSAALDSPPWFPPLVIQKAFEGFLLLLIISNFR